MSVLWTLHALVRVSARRELLNRNVPPAAFDS
jgi:hypothetical protein